MEQEKFEEKFQAQEKRFEKQEQNFREMVEKRQDVKIREQKTLFEDFKAGAKTELEELKRRCGVWKFTMNNRGFSKEKAKDSEWKSLPMYTSRWLQVLHRHRCQWVWSQPWQECECGALGDEGRVR